MDLQQSKRYFPAGYIFVPCVPDDFHHNQLQGIQAIPSSYTSSIRKYDFALPEQNQNQPATASRNISHHSDCTCRVVFPAIYRQRSTVYGVSRHNIGVESLPVSRLGGRY